MAAGACAQGRGARRPGCLRGGRVAVACVVAVAERLKTAQVATLDHRHFTVVRPNHVPAFELFPHAL
jgi:hypothetical protein